MADYLPTAKAYFKVEIDGIDYGKSCGKSKIRYCKNDPQ